jgi:diadenosine tetraphosphate (Ap4A) HIT family hydrolase
MFDVMNAIGAHELVSDTRNHAQSWADFSAAQMAELLAMYRSRIRDLARDQRFRYAIVLKNHGAAWSHFGHAHSHVIATPFTPRRLEEELAGAREYHRMRERCAFCDQVQEELRVTARLVGRQRALRELHAVRLRVRVRDADRAARALGGLRQLPDDALEPLGAMLVDALARPPRSRSPTRRTASRSTRARSTGGDQTSSTGTGRSSRTSAASSAWSGRPASSRTRCPRRRAAASARLDGAARIQYRGSRAAGSAYATSAVATTLAGYCARGRSRAR